MYLIFGYFQTQPKFSCVIQTTENYNGSQNLQNPVCCYFINKGINHCTGVIDILNNIVLYCGVVVGVLVVGVDVVFVCV
jgi:hypothetical protein